ATGDEPRPGAPQRQPVAAQALDGRRVEPVLRAQPAEMAAQVRPFAEPAADADVDVVALREDPPVPARDLSELDYGATAVPVGPCRGVGDVPLVGDAVVVVAAQVGRPRRDPVRAVGPDDDVPVEA